MIKYVLIKQGDKPEKASVESKFFGTYKEAFQALKKTDRIDLTITIREVT